MNTAMKPTKTCRVCAMALVIPLGYLSLAATGLVGPAGASPAQAATEQKEDAQGATQKQRQVDTLVASYLQVQNLLAQDKLDGVKAQLATIGEHATALAGSDDPKLAAQAQTVAKHASAAEPETIEQARESFRPLSAAVIGLVQLVEPTAQVAPALYEATCPMAKANWLQTTRELENPYMGKAMLKCGSIKQTIKEPAPGSKESQGSAQRKAAAAGGSCCSMGK